MSGTTDIRNYAIVTLAYWGFTLSDGALRMLVLLHFHTLGYTPFQLATLFLLYEFMGMLANLTGGWIGARFGLKRTLSLGLSLQVLALAALAATDPLWPVGLSVLYVLTVQGLSGVAKDFCKMSSKSAIKLLVGADAHGLLFKWVALLTGSKNALKGVGFFLGGLMLATLGFVATLLAMAASLLVILLLSGYLLPVDMGRVGKASKLRKLFSKSTAINRLSAARVFLFGARDVWFVVGLPVYLHSVLGWSFTAVGSFMASWVIGYGLIQGLAPRLVKRGGDGRTAETRAARLWIGVLIAVTLALALAIGRVEPATLVLIGGLALFGAVFAINSSLHSYLILAFSQRDEVALDVGFYYMANAAGRLGGTLLSGWAYHLGGIEGCLWVATALLVGAGLFTSVLPLPKAGARPVETG